ncbi:polygalacturonase At1g48100-like [Papaver somniferum]|uniref:polygalacturonase At1g48100-like n=1 Tax=Papaver somniferum TaxID=3469 RepID=UPI000E6F7252|nr:polygalacturonase At1g48100-like [Papaver somniferum]
MREVNLKHFTFALLVTILVWSSTYQSCNARRGKHWSHSRTTSDSLYKKKYKNHGNSYNHHGGGYKSKSPPKPPVKGYTPVVPPPSYDDDNPTISSTTFNVLQFGAKGDGNTDDTKAFEAAWVAACKVEASTVLVPPNYVFLVGPISFSGPCCRQNIVFQLDGTIIAPTSWKAWGSGLFQWILFSKLNGISVQGKGIIDGRGSLWWKESSQLDESINDESLLVVPITNTTTDKNNSQAVTSSDLFGKMPSIKPTALRFYGSFNATVTGITIQNSPQCHLKFDNCVGVEVFNMNVTSPGNSLNTDGIHLQNSKDVVIHSTNLACGDDCVSVQTGCSNIYIHNVNCGPGHGISIGGLGKDNTKACVSNITVRDVVMHNTTNGVRIKTWQGGSGSVQGVLFSNIQVSEVEFPIVIDQYYCDKRICKNQTSAVALSGINYEKIRGTYTIKPVHFACSDSLPCEGVTLTNIKLEPQQERYRMFNPFCWQTFGELNTPSLPPIDCLQIGKPSSNRIQSDRDSC